jgi:hypothetical protein
MSQPNPIKFASPIDLDLLEIQNVLLEDIGDAPGNTPTARRIAWNSDLANFSIQEAVPVWSNGMDWFPIRPPAFTTEIAETDGTAKARVDSTGFLEFFPGTTEVVANIVGQLRGRASHAIELVTPITLNITGKATAGNVSIKTGGDALSLNVTAIAVEAGDISLANGKILTGNGSDIATAVTRGSVSLSDWGVPTSDLNIGSKRLTSVLDPVNDQDAATRGWVIGQLGGVSPKTPVRLTTAAALATYTSNGLPATVLTASANGALTIDGVATSASDRVLVKNETAANEKNNGAYAVTQTGSAGTPWVLTRVTDADTDAEVTTGDEYFTSAGDTNGGTKWALQTAEPITLGTTGLVFVQTDGNTNFNAGNGMVKVGTTFHFGQSSNYTAGGLPYAASTVAIGFTAAPTSKQVMIGSGGGLPTWGKVDLLSESAIENVLGSGHGGTGNSTVVDGDLLYGSGGTWARLAKQAAGKVLLSGDAPSWGLVDLTTHVTGKLPAAMGGTNVTTLTANAVAYGGAGGTSLAFVSGTTSQFLQINGGGTPDFETMTGDATLATGGTITIAARSVTFAKMQDVGTKTVAGRTASGSGVMSDISFATLASELGPLISPTTTLTGTVTGSGAGSIATVVPLAALSVLGVSASSPGNAAAITAATVGHSLRYYGSTLGFGSIDLSNSSATTGALPTSRGGTGRTVALVFPNVAGLVARIRKITLASGSQNYVNLAHGFTNKHLMASLVDSSGNVVYANIVLDDTYASVAFGRVTTASHTLILVGSDQAETQSPA